MRRRFNTEYGAHLPEDICLCIGNSPTRWEVVPWPGDSPEVLPHIDDDLLMEVSNQLSSLVLPAEFGSYRPGEKVACIC